MSRQWSRSDLIAQLRSEITGYFGAASDFDERVARRFKLSRTEIEEPFRTASPIAHICHDAPPFFVLHGRNDSLIPVEQARSFTARLREVSREPVVYAELPCAQHAFEIFGSPRAAHAAVAVEQFLAEVYAKRPVSV